MNFYAHWTKRLIYTEGVRQLAEEQGAYWLIDAIASYQPGIERRDARLRDFQLWNLKVKDSKAKLECWADTGPGERAVVKQFIEFTDFPEGELKLYLERGERMTLMLPEER